MNLSAPFIERPVGTTLLTIAVALAGVIAFVVLPVAPLPQVDFPTISVSATLPGASADIMAASVATPLERQFSHIAGITEMTSSSSLNSTSVTLQFDLSRNIDGAARDVQAAINAARTYLPADLPQNPSYKKVNPADSPIMIISLTSNKYPVAKLYDLASTILEQKLSQIQGVGQVNVGGGATPSVRVEVNPTKLESFGLTLGSVQSVLSLQNSHEPRGQLSNNGVSEDIIDNDQISDAADYRPLIIGYHNGEAVRLSDVADVEDSTENVRAAGYVDGIRGIFVIIYRQPGANIIQTVDRIRAQMPFLEAVLPQGINTTIVLDRTTTIRASVSTVEHTLIGSVVLVVLVVFLFLRSPRATLIPTVAVPVSLIGTFAAMYVFGYTLDNLSLMALTIATGFVVDDAIVVMENITRHVEAGMEPMAAALKGAQEIGSTVFTISMSLIAVFIPILMMGGIVGRLFREFAVTLSTAIVISMVISLTTTPSMCAHVLKAHKKDEKHNWFYRSSEKVFDGMVWVYRQSLLWALDNPVLILIVLILTVALNFLVIYKIPKGFFPEQDTGVLVGGVQGPQDASFQFMNFSLVKLVNVVTSDPAVAHVNAFTGGQGAINSGFLFIALKPLGNSCKEGAKGCGVRQTSAMNVINRLRPRMNELPVASAFLQAAQDLRIGGRSSSAMYQYTIQSDSNTDLAKWGPILLENMGKLPDLQDVNTDQQNGGLEELLNYDRITAARLGQTAESLDNSLYSAFGQSEVSVIYTQLNQYYVVLEVAPKYWEDPSGLKNIYFATTSTTPSSSSTSTTSGGGGSSSAPTTSSSTSTTSTVSTTSPSTTATSSSISASSPPATTSPTTASTSSSSGTPATTSSSSGGSSSASPPTLAGLNVVSPLFTAITPSTNTTPLQVNHTGLFPSVTVSFNMKSGASLSNATQEVTEMEQRLGMPATIQGFFAGTAQAYQESLSTEPILILTALLSVFIVLGILYESLVHPLTIISTLPSASVGAMLALMIFHVDLNVISIIGIILLIGIVKKNAIMMIDFALQAERVEGKNTRDAIFEACLLRFRPIMMTTMAAICGALPLAFGTGTGSELRKPLGITIVGGLLLSQVLTLYTTPVIYLFMDRLRLRMLGRTHETVPSAAEETAS